MSLILNGTDGLSDVDGSASTPAIRGTDTNTGIFFPAADTIAFTEGGAESMRIDSSGNLLIGGTSTTPFSGTSGLGVTRATNPAIYISQTQSTGGYTAKDYVNYIVADGSLGWYDTTALAERMRITSGGSLLVGTTSPISSGFTTISYAGGSLNGLIISESAGTSGTAFLGFNSGATNIGSVSRVGLTNAVVYSTTSDQRLKSNIADANPVLDKLMTVKVRQFDWTEGDLHQDAGFIAQELAPVLSGIVTEGKTEEDMWQMDYSRLTPYLVKAVQELNAKVEAQAIRIAELEGAK
jgi:hypothetical protein